jgi:hypothetical protein
VITIQMPRVTLEGVGPDAPTVVNEKGGKQSLVKGRFDLLPPLALIEVAMVLEEGAKKYGMNNWKNIESSSHINHALAHLFLHLTNRSEEDDLGHAACRILMALEMKVLEEAHG